MGDQDNSAEEYRRFHANEFAVWLSSDVARLFASRRFALLGAGGLDASNRYKLLAGFRINWTARLCSFDFTFSGISPVAVHQ